MAPNTQCVNSFSGLLFCVSLSFPPCVNKYFPPFLADAWLQLWTTVVALVRRCRSEIWPLLPPSLRVLSSTEPRGVQRYASGMATPVEPPLGE
jgi:hypothetical protein